MYIFKTKVVSTTPQGKRSDGKHEITRRRLQFLGLLQMLILGMRMNKTASLSMLTIVQEGNETVIDSGPDFWLFWARMLDHALLFFAIICILGATRDRKETPYPVKLSMIAAWWGVSFLYNLATFMIMFWTLGWGSCYWADGFGDQGQWMIVILGIIMMFLVFRYNKRIEEMYQLASKKPRAFLAVVQNSNNAEKAPEVITIA